jgi:hypothetical protein
MDAHYARLLGAKPRTIYDQEAWLGCSKRCLNLKLAHRRPRAYLVRYARWRLLDSPCGALAAALRSFQTWLERIAAMAFAQDLHVSSESKPCLRNSMVRHRARRGGRCAVKLISLADFCSQLTGPRNAFVLLNCMMRRADLSAETAVCAGVLSALWPMLYHVTPDPPQYLMWE